MHRRAFFTATVTAGAAAAFRRRARTAQVEARLRLSCQEWVVAGRSLAEKVAKLARWGIEGLEVGGRGLADRTAELKQALRGSGVAVSAVCAGYDGALAHHDPAARAAAIASMKAILGPAGELGAAGLIFVPALTLDRSALSAREVRKILAGVLPALGEAARTAGTRLLLEPLNRTETPYVHRLADAAAIVREAGHPGVAVAADFHHMGREEASDRRAVLAAGPYLAHVHLATTKRRILPGQEARDFADGFRGLKEIGYRGFASFECGVAGDRDREIPRSAAFLHRQWEAAGQPPCTPEPPGRE
jgi:sugar phosphate isomerase/epimerase